MGARFLEPGTGPHLETGSQMRGSLWAHWLCSRRNCGCVRKSEEDGASMRERQRETERPYPHPTHTLSTLYYLTMEARLAWNSLCGPTWPQTQSSPPASVFHTKPCRKLKFGGIQTVAQSHTATPECMSRM